MTDHDLLMYCHIGKVGGKHLQFYLRSSFGLQYRGVSKAIDPVYSLAELCNDLKFNPSLRYIGGHAVRPHVDFGKHASNQQWFSIFRDPTSRVLSHYYQQVHQRNFQVNNILDWLAKYPSRQYWQIYMISGTNNRQKAQEIITEKYSFVGLNERYEETLFLLKKHFNLNSFHFTDGRSSTKPEEISLYEDIRADYEKNIDGIAEILNEEIAFYQFVSKIYKQQVNQYGEQQLASDLEHYLLQSLPISKMNLNNITANTADVLFWRPKTSLHRKLRNNRKLDSN